MLNSEKKYTNLNNALCYPLNLCIFKILNFRNNNSESIYMYYRYPFLSTMHGSVIFYYHNYLLQITGTYQCIIHYMIH